jgi:Sulfotransferase family
MAMDIVSIPYWYVASLLRTVRQPELFDNVESYVMFIGYPRSAHTLVGFLLDAHPNAIIASQVSGLKYLKHGFASRQIFYVLLQNSRRVAKFGRGWRPYSYDVPNQWQGRFETIKVIGDCTGMTRLRKHPAQLRSLRSALGKVQLKLIHCVRNPYDNISTMKMRSQRTLPAVIDAYFSMCQTVDQIKNWFDRSLVYDLRHEDLIDNPTGTLKDLCGFLGLSANESYYQDCASIVYKSPHKSFAEVAWNRTLIDAVNAKMSRFDFLSSYSYAE